MNAGRFKRGRPARSDYHWACDNYFLVRLSRISDLMYVHPTGLNSLRDLDYGSELLECVPFNSRAIYYRIKSRSNYCISIN